MRWHFLALVGLVALLTIGVTASGAAAPTSVTVAGSLQSELGSGDWQPDCAITLVVAEGSTYYSSGTQTVGDTVENWRNVAPCGN